MKCCLVVYEDINSLPALAASVRALLHAYDTVECMPGVFVVARLTHRDHAQLIGELHTLAMTTEPITRMIVTPLLEDSRFEGWLPMPTWHELNQKTGLQ